jgi:hypothetical protein
MRWLLRAGLVAFISANSKIFFRTGVSAVIIFIGNLLYNKFEALLLATNPDQLFIPLYTFTTLTIFLIFWTLASLISFKSLAESKRVNGIRESYNNKPSSFLELADINKHPKLKTRSENILGK